MLDEAIYRGKQTPSFKYHLEESEKQTRPRTAVTRMFPQQRVKGQVIKSARGKPLKKQKEGACVGVYKTYEYEHKIVPKARVVNFAAGAKADGKCPKKTSFIDDYVKSKKLVPGMGKYTGFETGFDKLSGLPRSISRKR